MPGMRVESDGHSNGNPRLYELIENAPKTNPTGKSPTVWAWPQLIDHLKVAGPPAAAPVIADPLVRNRGTLVGSLCHADPQGDWAAVMISLGASVVAQGPRGRRVIPVADFVTGPFENALAHDEIAVEAVVPPAQGT